MVLDGKKKSVCVCGGGGGARTETSPIKLTRPRSTATNKPGTEHCQQSSKAKVPDVCGGSNKICVVVEKL